MGFVREKFLPVAFGFMGEIILYTTTGAKTNLLSGVIIILIYLLVRKKARFFGIRFIAAMILLIFFLNLGALIGTGIFQPIFFALASIVFMRTICMEGMLTAQYYHFFEKNPYTYFTHINVLGKIFHYPCGHEALGDVIGY